MESQYPITIQTKNYRYAPGTYRIVWFVIHLRWWCAFIFSSYFPLRWFFPHVWSRTGDYEWCPQRKKVRKACVDRPVMPSSLPCSFLVFYRERTKLTECSSDSYNTPAGSFLRSVRALCFTFAKGAEAYPTFANRQPKDQSTGNYLELASRMLLLREFVW